MHCHDYHPPISSDPPPPSNPVAIRVSRQLDSSLARQQRPLWLVSADRAYDWIDLTAEAQQGRTAEGGVFVTGGRFGRGGLEGANDPAYDGGHGGEIDAYDAGPDFESGPGSCSEEGVCGVFGSDFEGGEESEY